MHQLYELRILIRQLELNAGHADRRASEIEAKQDRMAAAIGKAREEARQAVEEINSRINGAILWLGLGAGGLILQIVGPKLGL